MDELLVMLRHQYSRHTIYRWVERYEMPHKRIRGKLWFPRTEVIQWLERSS
ncbi:DNA-binding protein [bacterium]|nr:DNA-binding protein [bacterium]